MDLLYSVGQTSFKKRKWPGQGTEIRGTKKYETSSNDMKRCLCPINSIFILNKRSISLQRAYYGQSTISIWQITRFA